MTDPSPSPATTKAWTFSHGGLPRAGLSLTTSHPVPPFPPAIDPSAADEEWLLISVSHAALNPGEVVFMAVMPTLVRAPAARAATVPVSLSPLHLVW